MEILRKLTAIQKQMPDPWDKVYGAGRRAQARSITHGNREACMTQGAHEFSYSRQFAAKVVVAQRRTAKIR